MELNEILDYVIMRSETAKNPEIKAGYVISGKTYGNYLENICFDAFVEDMKANYPTAYEMYGLGSGGELKIRQNRWGTFSPPKMASFGSSSRMIYNLMKDTKGFLFEKQLPTTVGGIANLDGFMETDSKYIFVEAKCREPYGAKSNVYEDKYEELYKFISLSPKTNITCDIENFENNKIKVTFKVNNKPIKNFDMKQMISHLLGVATGFLNGKFVLKSVEFIYLLFDPTAIEIADEKAKEKIYEIYKNTCDECNQTDFKALFDAIVYYLKAYKDLNAESDTNNLIDGFTFKLCSQKDMKI